MIAPISSGLFACALVAGLEDKQAFSEASTIAETGTTDATAVEAPNTDAGIMTDAGDAAQPVDVIQVVATGQGKPWDVAVDDGYVYWTNEGSNSVMRAPKAGGAPIAIELGQYEPHRLIVDPTSMFWHNANLADREGTDAGEELVEVARLPKALIGQDGGVDSLESMRGTSELKKLVVASVPDPYLWTTWDDKVRRLRRDGQGGGRDVMKNLTAQVPTAVAADAVNVYWFLQQPFQIWRSGKNFDVVGVDAGVAPIATLAGAPEIADMVADQDALYMVTTGGAVLKVPTPNGGAATQIGMGHAYPKAIVADDKYLYFTRSDANDAPGQGMVVMVAKSGTETRIIAQGLDKPRGLTVDKALNGSVTLYWVTYGDGMVRRIRVR